MFLYLLIYWDLFYVHAPEKLNTINLVSSVLALKRLPYGYILIRVG